MAAEGDVLVAGSVTQCPSYTQGLGKEAVQANIRTQMKSFVKNKVDFIIAEVCPGGRAGYYEGIGSLAG